MPTLNKRFFLAICLLTWTKGYSTQIFKIRREISKDYFTIPSSECGPHDCPVYKAKSTKNSCECVCDGTFSFQRKGNWSCIGNEEARSLFGCTPKTFFKKDKKSASKMIYMKSGSQEDLSLMGDTHCAVADMASTWYIDCHGNRKTFVPIRNMFTIIKSDHDEPLSLELNLPPENPLTVNLTGRVINLGITCTRNAVTTRSCLLFKIEGTTECPVLEPQKTRETIPVTDADQEIHVGPSSAADQKSNGGSSGLSLGLIAGIGAFLILTLAIGFLVYRWKYSRKEVCDRHTDHKDQAGQASQSGFHSDEQNAIYATIGNSESTLYASNYKVPSRGRSSTALTALTIPIPNTDSTEGQYEHVSDESLHRDFPFSKEKYHVYNILEHPGTETTDRPYEYVPTEEYQRDMPRCGLEQPVYNLLEPFGTDTTDRSDKCVPTGQQQKKTSSGALEESVYNGLEPLDTNTTDRCYEYVPTEEYQKKTPVGAFEQREYNLIEAFCSNYGPVKTASAPPSIEQRIDNFNEDFNFGYHRDDTQGPVNNML